MGIKLSIYSDLVYYQNCYGGGGGTNEAGVVDRESGNSERCLKWGEGVIKESFQKHLKIGDGKRQLLFVGGGGLKGVTTPALPKMLIVHVTIFSSYKGSVIFYQEEGGFGNFLSFVNF